MSRALATTVVPVALLMFAGCASNAIIGDQLTQEDQWYGELGVTGHLNKLTVLGESQLTRLSVIGDANTIVVQDDATLAKIEIFGENNTISVPENLVIRESILGKGNQVIRRPMSWKVAADTEPQPPPSEPAGDTEETDEP
jgi:hypothetical protein